jgi:protein-L-isoaspartate O-methyltransferase
MTNDSLEWMFSCMQSIVFKRIGSKVRTNALKGLMDIVFIVFEKIGSKFDVIGQIYLKLYHDIVAKETALVHLSKKDKALVIGGGSLPATPVLLALSTDATIVSIDRDRTAVKEATQYVRTHHLEKNLSIVYADGLHYPVQLYDVIFVLYGVKQPETMLQHIAGQITEKTRVVLRVITDAHGALTDKTIDVTEHFIIKDRVRTETLGSFESLLLMKKP